MILSSFLTQQLQMQVRPNWLKAHSLQLPSALLATAKFCIRQSHVRLALDSRELSRQTVIPTLLRFAARTPLASAPLYEAERERETLHLVQPPRADQMPKPPQG